MLACSLSLAAAVIATPPNYTATVLPQLDTTDDPNLLTFTSPFGLNDGAVVTGGLGSGEGFVWSEDEGGQLLVPMFGGLAEEAYGNDVNNQGSIAGVYKPADGGPLRAFFLTDDGVVTPLPAIEPDLSAGASDLNDAGLVVGATETAPGGPFGGPTAAVYWLDGAIHVIGGLGGMTSGLRAVNDNGLGVGAANTAGELALKPFRWTMAGGIEVLPQLVDGVPAVPADVNDNGLIVGRAGTSLMANEAVYWTPEGKIHELPGLDPQGFDIGVLAVNNEGVMVGQELVFKTFTPEARVWIDDEVFRLADYVVNPPEGVELMRATDINNAGQIVIEGRTIVDGAFQFVSVLLTPVGACAADCNGDGSLNILDFICYQKLFQSGDPAADCNGDGMLNILDFVCFQEAFQAGC